MRNQWQLQDTKNRLSQVVQQAEHHAQVITVRGKPTAVVLSVGDYDRLTRPRNTLVEFMRDSPLHELELDLTRSRDAGRQVDL